MFNNRLLLAFSFPFLMSAFCLYAQVSVGINAQTGQPVTIINPMHGGRDTNMDRLHAALSAQKAISEYISSGGAAYTPNQPNHTNENVMYYNGAYYEHFHKVPSLKKMAMFHEFLNIIDYNNPNDEKALYKIEDHLEACMSEFKEYMNSLIAQRKADFKRAKE
jgi:hypothetical protein